MFAATALYNISSILKWHFKFHRNRWYVVSKYSKTFSIKKFRWAMKGTPNVEPSNSRWLLKLPFAFLLFIFREYLPYIWGRGKEKSGKHSLYFTLLQLKTCFPSCMIAASMLFMLNNHESHLQIHSNEQHTYVALWFVNNFLAMY